MHYLICAVLQHLARLENEPAYKKRNRTSPPTAIEIAAERWDFKDKEMKLLENFRKNRRTRS